MKFAVEEGSEAVLPSNFYRNEKQFLLTIGLESYLDLSPTSAVSEKRVRGLQVAGMEGSGKHCSQAKAHHIRGLQKTDPVCH